MDSEKALTVAPENGKEVVGIPTVNFTRDQIELVKRTVAKGATDDELALFLYTCKRTGLDPLAKQIHCVKRNSKNGAQATFQTAIDGYRLVADRTGKYAGNDDPIYDGGPDHPDKASVTVYKLVSGMRVAFTASARWSEYFPGESQGFMWKKMPFLMLGKCAEALALRKAFPAELSGVYTNEEMQQADGQDVNTSNATPESPKPKTEITKPGCITTKQASRFYAIGKSAGKTDEQMKDFLEQAYNIASTKDIKVEDYDTCCAWAEKKSEKVESL